MLILETPTRLRLPKAWCDGKIREELAFSLGYEDKRVTFEWRTWHKVQKRDNTWLESDQSSRRHWFIEKNGREALDDLVANLEAQRSKSCLFEDERGLWTHSGLLTRVQEIAGAQKVERAYKLPESKVIPWENAPDKQPRWYQSKSVEELVPRAHGAVELATGLGKSFIIALLLKRLGLPAVIMAPTLSIANQLLADLRRLFGKRRVGQFFDGKKEADRYFVVAVSKSLTSLDDASPLWPKLKNRGVLIGDEAHMLPAETLAKIVLGSFADVPYRFFLSGTQLRTDGLQIVLDGIIGDIVLEMNVRQGVQEGFLSPIRFFQFSIDSDRKFTSDDVIKMNRVHLHENQKVYKHAASQVKWSVNNGRRPLVMIEEVSQFAHFLDEYLKLGGNPDKIGFAHGGVNKEHKGDPEQGKKPLVPKEFWKSDPMALVEDFDAGGINVLVGTSCIGMGTDIRSASHLVDLVGNKAEAHFRQRAGRLTRLFPGKKDAIYSDYSISNIEPLAKQAVVRAKFMEDILGPVTFKVAS